MASKSINIHWIRTCSKPYWKVPSAKITISNLEDSNEDEQELAERVKKKLKTFKLQRMFKTMKYEV